MLNSIDLNKTAKKALKAANKPLLSDGTSRVYARRGCSAAAAQVLTFIHGVSTFFLKSFILDSSASAQLIKQPPAPAPDNEIIRPQAERA